MSAALVDATPLGDERPRSGSRRSRPSRQERRIAAGLRRGDTGALRALYDEHASMVFGYLQRVLGNRATAEDVLQQVFTEAWRRGEQYDPDRASLTTWLMTIARSRAIDELRRHVPEPRDPTTLPETGEDSQSERLAERFRLGRLIAVLPPDEAEMLRLRFYEELTQTEIADRTGIALGTVKTRMVRALERMRDLIEADDLRERRALGRDAGDARPQGAMA